MWTYDYDDDDEDDVIATQHQSIPYAATSLLLIIIITPFQSDPFVNAFRFRFVAAVNYDDVVITTLLLVKFHVSQLCYMWDWRLTEHKIVFFLFEFSFVSIHSFRVWMLTKMHTIETKKMCNEFIYTFYILCFKRKTLVILFLYKLKSFNEFLQIHKVKAHSYHI